MTPLQFLQKWFISRGGSIAFLTVIIVNLADGARQTIKNFTRACSNEVATDLAATLQSLKPVIYQDTPYGPDVPWFGYELDDTSGANVMVPWLQFDGFNQFNAPVRVTVNAGVLADFYNHGYPPQYADAMIRKQVTDAPATADPTNPIGQ